METGYYSHRVQALDYGSTGKREKLTAQELAQIQRETKDPSPVGAPGGFPILSSRSIQYQHL